MKKLISVLAAMMMVFGLAMTAAADPCTTCEEDPGYINRGCETGQFRTCDPFDYENVNQVGWEVSYCDFGKDDQHRALFKVCDCITDGTWSGLNETDTVDIAMEIVVDGDTGDNGVYWAQIVDSIPLETYKDVASACKGTVQTKDFNGPFRYLLANGNDSVNGPNVAIDDCSVDSDERVVRIEFDDSVSTTTGYMVDKADVDNDTATWWIDIPHMRVDPDMVEGGEEVWVKICLTRNATGGGICDDDIACCCLVYIGTLCCPEDPGDTIDSMKLAYPYFPPMDSSYWGLMGMVITSLSDDAGTATVTVYETDGDIATITIDLDPREVFLTTMQELKGQLTMTTSVDGTLGNAKLSAIVDVDVNANGFVMIANPNTGESMGYLPVIDIVGMAEDFLGRSVFTAPAP